MKKKSSKRTREAATRIVTVAARTLLTVGMLCLGIYGVYYARHSLHAGGYFKLGEVEYRGVKHLEKEALTSLIHQTCPENLLAADLDSVRGMVEAEAWVRKALVRRKLPGKLIIQVSERVPTAVAAIDDALYVVDDEGVVLDSFGPEYQSIDRPIVRGLSNVAQENAQHQNSERISVYMQVLREFESPERDYTKTIAEIDVSNPEKVVVVPVQEPVVIYLGRDQFRKRYEAYLSQKPMYYKLKQIHGEVEYIDVSYDNKVIFHTPEKAVTG